MSTPPDWLTQRRVIVRPDPQAVAALVAQRLVDRLVDWTARRTVHLALTGGTTGTAVLRAVGDHADAARIDWTRVHAWWSDERFVPHDSPDRNAGQARAALLDRVAIPAANVHEMAAGDGGLDLDSAARAYAHELARFARADGAPWPSFDVCLLGVGPDAHIASLFPDHPEIRITDAAVVGVRDSPKPPPERITLTRPVINASQRVWMALTGADKASALGLVLAGASYTSVPAAGAKGRRRTLVFVDTAAAAQVPPELIAES